VGLARRHWSTASPIRAIFRAALEAVGLPLFNPHSFRTTLAQLGESVCQNPEQFKAWSQNLGHEGALTTFLSHGSVAPRRQGQAEVVAQAVLQAMRGRDSWQPGVDHLTAHAIAAGARWTHRAATPARMSGRGQQAGAEPAAVRCPFTALTQTGHRTSRIDSPEGLIGWCILDLGTSAASRCMNSSRNITKWWCRRAKGS
jgi:hypothetical protein